MTTERNPFEQFAQNASGVNIAPPPVPVATEARRQAAPQLYGIGDGLSAGGTLQESLGFAPYVVGALGFGVLSAYMAQRSRRPMVSGALANAGSMALIVGVFGSSLSNMGRGLYAVGGLGMLGGSWYFARK